MSLADLVAIRDTVETPGGNFEVQGLTLEALAGLMGEHSEELSSLFDGKLDFAVLIKESPALVSKLIAYAAGEPKEIDKVRALPFGMQLIAMKKIWDLTAVDIDELGNLFRNLMDGMENLTKIPTPESKKK